MVLARVKQRNERLHRAARTPEQIEAARMRRHPLGTKQCTRCRRELAFDRFEQFAREPDGLNTHCKDCRKGANDD
jgi:hypothetical protein